MSHLHRALALAPFALFVACSSSSSDPAAPPQADAGTPADAGPTPDAYVDAYEQAVFAATWQALPNAPTTRAKMDDVFFVSPKVAYLANGPSFSVDRSDDGGETWKTSFSNKGTFFRAVAFLDDKHGFAGNLGAGLSSSITDTNVLYETKDSGATWSPVTAITGPKPEGICNLTVIDPTHLVAVGRANGPAHALFSSDAGASFTSVDLGDKLSMAIDAHFSSPSEGVVVGMSAGAGTPGAPPGACTIVRTTDGGKTFSTVFTSTTKNSLCWKVQFPTSQVGYVAVQDTTVGPATFAKTTDGRKTWVEKPLPVQGNSKGAFPAIGIGFINERIGWVAPEDEKLGVYRTKDGGETWEPDPTLKAPINRFRFVDKNTAYAVGGKVWKLSIDGKF